MAKPKARPEWAKEDADRAKAEKIFAEGPKAYGFFWLRANQAAVRVLHDAGIDTQKNKLLRGLIATEIARFYTLGQKNPEVTDG